MSFFQEYLDDLVMEKVADYITEMEDFGTRANADRKVQAKLQSLLGSKKFQEADDKVKMQMYREAKASGLGAYTKHQANYLAGRKGGEHSKDTAAYLNKLENVRGREAYNALHPELGAADGGGASGYLARAKAGLASAGKHIAAHKGAYGAGAGVAALGGGAYLYNRNKKKR